MGSTGIEMTYKLNYTYHSTLKEFPKTEPHYAVLIENYITYDDGYGSHGQSSYSSKHYLEYISFDDEEALKEWIVKNKDKSKYQVIYVKPIEPKITVNVDVGL